MRNDITILDLRDLHQLHVQIRLLHHVIAVVLRFVGQAEAEHVQRDGIVSGLDQAGPDT